MNRFLSPRVGLVLVVGACLLPGCAKSSSSKLVPVAGQVTLDKKPVSGGQVSLIPAGKEGEGGLSTGTIDADGNYKILTNGKEGAPLGKYKVTVTPPMMPMDVGKKGPVLPIPMKYGNTTDTPLSFEVVENPAPGAYDLKLSK